MTALKNAKKEFAKSIREAYQFKKASLEKDVKLLWSETPGQSMFDSEHYAKLTISSHPYINDSKRGVISSEQREILGLDFLVDYFTTINHFKDGLRRYHPSLI
jgi:hypothetical protein